MIQLLCRFIALWTHYGSVYVLYIEYFCILLYLYALIPVLYLNV